MLIRTFFYPTHLNVGDRRKAEDVHLCRSYTRVLVTFRRVIELPVRLETHVAQNHLACTR